MTGVFQAGFDFIFNLAWELMKGDLDCKKIKTHFSPIFLAIRSELEISFGFTLLTYKLLKNNLIFEMLSFIFHFPTSCYSEHKVSFRFDMTSKALIHFEKV